MAEVDYSKLTDREIDALVAERVMGLKVIDTPFVPASIQPSDKTKVLTDRALEQYRVTFPGGMLAPHIAFYSTNDNAARLVRNQIAELGLSYDFDKELNEFTDRDRLKLVYGFRQMQATPHQQCVAALRALQSGEEVRLILREMMSKVWTEAFYDAYDEKSYAIAHMLWPSMQRLNEIMKFK